MIIQDRKHMFGTCIKKGNIQHKIIKFQNQVQRNNIFNPGAGTSSLPETASGSSMRVNLEEEEDNSQP